MQSYHNKTIQETEKLLNTNIKTGLREKEALSRLITYGKNELSETKRKSIFKKFLEQFNDFMIIILLGAAGISFITSIMQGDADITESVIILAIVFFNAVLGVVQEERAEKSIDSLKKIASPHSCVLRDGKSKTIPSSEVVIGDILILSSGDIVSADCRIISSNSLTVNESSLTGESADTQKNENIVLDALTPLGDRKNIIFATTAVTGGNCSAIVTATGMNTEVGRIADMLNTSENTQTPLQKRLSETGKTLGIVALSVCLIIFIIGLIKHIDPFNMFITAVSLAVAAIPEGLPAIVTIMLSIGVMRMSRHNAIVRNLPSVETLGSASVICSDKTGTLTQNKMTVTEIFSQDEVMLLELATLCCNYDGCVKNPTENAILTEAKKRKISQKYLLKRFRKTDEIPFNSTRKRMTTMHKTSNGTRIIVKGALEFVLPLCNNYRKGDKNISISPQIKRKILNENSKMTSNGLRVIAVCYKDDLHNAKINETNMTFVGLIGIEDPPRREVCKAVEECKKAGIRPVMITGDHAMTALAIARKTGIILNENSVMTGEELDSISDSELAEKINSYSVFARVTPSHKMKIIKAFKASGETVAMTGDGVNDAPALSAADIGCSMGITGTDVAKSASDIILTDDNFATIIYAVKEGRTLYGNIKRAVQFLLSSNIGEIITVFTSIMFGFSSPLTAIQLLWINLITDSLPAIALGMELPSSDIMTKPPRSAKKGLFADGLWLNIIFEGIMVGIIALLAYIIGTIIYHDTIYGRTISFAVLSISQLIHAFNMRSEYSVFKIGFFTNPYLVISLIIGTFLQVSVISIPHLANIFGVICLSPIGWIATLLLSVLPLIIVETQKFVTSLFGGKYD